MSAGGGGVPVVVAGLCLCPPLQPWSTQTRRLIDDGDDLQLVHCIMVCASKRGLMGYV
jgi:hypothetical protein